MVRFRIASSASIHTRDLCVSAAFSITLGSAPADGLAGEIASYRTPSELADLRAVLARYPDDTTEEIRSILQGS